MDRRPPTQSYLLFDCCAVVNGRDGPEAVLPPDLHTTQQLLREAQYYQLTGLEQLLQAQVQTLTEVGRTSRGSVCILGLTKSRCNSSSAGETGAAAFPVGSLFRPCSAKCQAAASF